MSSAVESFRRLRTVKIALLQINPTVGDLEGNARLIADAAAEAKRHGADLAVTPELALVGYLPRDLLLSGDFVERSWQRLDWLAAQLAGGPPTLVGLPELNRSQEGRPLFNTAALIRTGSVRTQAMVSPSAKADGFMVGRSAGRMSGWAATAAMILAKTA